MSNDRGRVVVVGAGPGIGAAVARRFGAEGHPIGLIARNRERLDGLAGELGGDGLDVRSATADIREPDGLARAMGELGDAEVLCFSPLPDVSLIKPVADTAAADLAAALELNVVGAAAAVQAVLPGMRRRGRGTLLFTTGGAAVQPSHERAVSGVVYGAEVGYARMLHEALAPEGIHVAVVTIVGAVGPGKTHEPAAIAEQLWNRHVDREELQTVLR